MYGFVKIAAVSPMITVAAPSDNAESAIREIKKLSDEGAQIIALPEMFLSGYTCGDLVRYDTLLNACETALEKMMSETPDGVAVVVGLPIRAQQGLFNCAVVYMDGSILGVVPKSYLPNYGELYEKRWFISGFDARINEVELCGEVVPFGNILFHLGKDIVMGIELCDDLWAPIPPSTRLALKGANVIVNVSASDELVAKDEYRIELIKSQSAKLMCAYAYASAGIGESTTDVVFSGACTVVENGCVLAEGERFSECPSAIACVDVEKLIAERRSNTTFADSIIYEADACDTEHVYAELQDLDIKYIDRYFAESPFIPDDAVIRSKRCDEILNIQAHGLTKRMRHTHQERAVVGISGGLDSTLALLVTAKAMDIMGLPRENIICITMPGFGTTDMTYENALELIRVMGAELREISIKDACLQHFSDIGHDPSVHDVTYENTQARERTQILMDIANANNAMLVGTGDLSEIAMGWCTYNGDHMSMYGVNASVPKTLVRYIVANYAEKSDKRTGDVLMKVYDTPVSPELLPPDENGQIAQKTEENIGPYELHDFYLYYFVRFGFSARKLIFMAVNAFKGKYTEEEAEKWLRLFIRRFFISQFKRSCCPDAPKVGSVALSPRGDWKMPSDAQMKEWLDF